MLDDTLARLLRRSAARRVLEPLLEGLDPTLSVRGSGGERLLGAPLQHGATVPLVIDGEVLGYVSGTRQAHVLADLLAHLLQQELDKKALARESLAKYKELSLLYTIGESIAATLDLESVAQRVLQEAGRLIEASACWIALIDDASGDLQTLAGSGNGPQRGDTLPRGTGLSGAVAVARQAEIVNDAAADPRRADPERRLGSLMCAPLLAKDKVFGVIGMGDERAVDYRAEDLKLFSAFAAQAATAIEIARLHEAKLRQEKFKSNLERYLGPELVSAVLAAGDDVVLGTHRRSIAIFFSDIRNFTGLSEDLDAGRLVNHLNEYFTLMADIIFRHGGTLNKYVGDMILALYGAPADEGENERRAIATALDMQRAIRGRRWTWLDRDFAIGIGINAGPVVVGNIGSPHHMDYTAIGDEVNTAHRLQSVARGGQIMVSRSVYERTRHSFDYREHGPVALKGKKKPCEVFEVLY